MTHGYSVKNLPWQTLPKRVRLQDYLLASTLDLGRGTSLPFIRQHLAYPRTLSEMLSDHLRLRSAISLRWRTTQHELLTRISTRLFTVFKWSVLTIAIAATILLVMKIAWWKMAAESCILCVPNFLLEVFL